MFNDGVAGIIIVNFIKNYKRGYKNNNNIIIIVENFREYSIKLIIINIKLLKPFVIILIIINFLIIRSHIFLLIIVESRKNSLIFS